MLALSLALALVLVLVLAVALALALVLALALTLASARDMSHLVKLSLPNICFFNFWFRRTKFQNRSVGNSCFHLNQDMDVYTVPLVP